MAFSKNILVAFTTGAALASFFYFLPRIRRQNDGNGNTNCSDGSADCNGDSAQSSQQTPLMDSVTLDQRMIRKAEGAIRNRTSRVIIVVERCTNDHNYSAILRTAEALGVQNIYIISPQSIQSTLEIDGNSDDDAELNNNTGLNGSAENNKGESPATSKDKKDNTKLKRSSGQIVKRATKSEKIDRALHHLFARNATEWLSVREFSDTKSCIKALRQEGREIWATDLSQVACCLTEGGLRGYWKSKAKTEAKRCESAIIWSGWGKLIGGMSQNHETQKLIPDKIAIVFGTEAVGCSAEMLSVADLRVYLPLRGFADSLNLSVATALIVHQLFVLDPTLVGAMTEEERNELRQTWYSKLASQRLLSAREKKKRMKLITYLKQCDEIGEKRESGEKLNKDELDKWNLKEEKKAELDAIDERVSRDSLEAVKDLVDSPPSPITDMRRCDEHRICFVGKKTKKMHGDVWAGMPATNKRVVEHNTTASFFRERAKKVT